MASTINTMAFDELDAPPDEIEGAFFPYPTDFIDTIHEHILPLKGYSTKWNCSATELVRRNQYGI